MVTRIFEEGYLDEMNQSVDPIQISANPHTNTPTAHTRAHTHVTSIPDGRRGTHASRTQLTSAYRRSSLLPMNAQRALSCGQYVDDWQAGPPQHRDRHRRFMSLTPCYPMISPRCTSVGGLRHLKSDAIHYIHPMLVCLIRASTIGQRMLEMLGSCLPAHRKCTTGASRRSSASTEVLGRVT